MSGMVISSVKKFIEMSQALQELGLDTIHFYNSENNRDPDPPMVTLVPFVDCIIVCKDTNYSGRFNKVIDEAYARRIPLLTEECLHEMKNFYYQYENEYH